MFFFTLNEGINGCEWSVIKNIYVPPIVNVPAPAPGLAPAIQTNINDIAQKMRNVAQHSLDRKDSDDMKKEIININNLPDNLKLIYLKGILKEHIIKSVIKMLNYPFTFKIGYLKNIELEMNYIKWPNDQ